MAVEIPLDVRDLEPPEPLLRVLGVLDGLRIGHYLRVVHRHDPHSLCQLIDQLGFAHEIRTNGNSICEIYFWLRSDKLAALAVQKATQG